MIYTHMSEYWIQADGDVEFADGDVGDKNHEMVVIDGVQRNILDKCQQVWHLPHGLDNYEYVDWDKFKSVLAKAYAQDLAKKYPAKTKQIQQVLHNNPDNFLFKALKAAGITKTDWRVAEGQDDARDYAMKNWGWKTYRNEHIDTWFFRDKDLKAIVRGVENIADDEGWDEVGDEKLEDKEFGITIHSTGKRLTLTYKQMQNPRKAQSPQQNNPAFGDLTNQATKQVRDMEISNMHPYYQQRTFPFGDSKLHSFKSFMESLGDAKRTIDYALDIETAQGTKKIFRESFSPDVYKRVLGRIMPGQSKTIGNVKVVRNAPPKADTRFSHEPLFSLNGGEWLSVDSAAQELFKLQ